MDLFGLLIVFVIIALATPTMVYMQKNSLMELRSSVAAEEMLAIAKAANNYITTNYYSLVSNVGATNLTVSQLQTDGFLTAAISEVSPYGGTWNVQIQSPKAGYVTGIITSDGGMPLNQKELGLVISQTHGLAGEVPPAGVTVNGQKIDANTAYGSYGGWTLSLTGYKNPGAGHLVGLLDYYNGEQINNDYLYRNAIAGHPELNTMQTNIDMANNSIDDVNTLQTGLPMIGTGACPKDLEGHCVGEIMAAGTSELNLPTGWMGGVITRDLYSQSGTIAVGPGQNNANSTNLVEALMNDRADNNVPETGGVVSTTSPAGNFSSSLLADDSNGYMQVVGANATTKMSVNNSTASIQAANTSGANTYLYANNDGNPQDTGLDTDGNIILGHDQNGTCSSNSRVYIAASQLYDDCDGNLNANPGGGTASAVKTNGSFLPGDIASSGDYCPVNGDIASDVDGSGHSLDCVNNEWVLMAQSAMAESSSSWCVNVPKYGLWLVTGAIHYQNNNNGWSASIYINGQYASSEQGEEDDATITGSVTTWGGPGPICMVTFVYGMNSGPISGGSGRYPLFINAIN